MCHCSDDAFRQRTQRTRQKHDVAYTWNAMQSAHEYAQQSAQRARQTKWNQTGRERVADHAESVRTVVQAASKVPARPPRRSLALAHRVQLCLSRSPGTRRCQWMRI